MYGPKRRVPGLIMLLFVMAGAIGDMRYGADLTPAARGIVGAFGALGLFWILASTYHNLIRHRP